jgi:2',3'-cyclic-nucleotide 2'-phosphodiesterase (5'-nucleotidase family)
LVGPDDVFSLALNSYRLRGGGGFSMLTSLPLVYDRGEDVRDLLINAIRRARNLRVEDYFVPSWSIVPAQAAAAAKAAFDSASDVAPAYTQTTPVETTPTVFAVEEPEPEEAPEELLPPIAPTIARMKFLLTRGVGEYALGRLLADARRNGVRAHFAIILNETIETDLPAGPIIHEDLIAMLPDDLSLARLTITGEELRAVLEYVVAADEPVANISGMEVWYDTDRDVGRRIRNVRLPDGRDVRDNQSYTLAVSASLFEGTDGYPTVRWLPREEIGLSDIEVFTNYLKLLRQPVEAPSENRFHPSR